MNTNILKSFAKTARIQLLDAVGKKILYWGFSTKGEVLEEPQVVQGGFMHRGEAYDDSTVVPKWNRLKEKITANKEAFKDVAEEAAYTWFNRLVAIKVLEENGFIEPFLQFVTGSQTPVALQNAKAGNHAVTHSVLKANLQAALLASQEEKAFHILLINFCNQHPLLREIFGQVNDYTELLIPHDLLAPDGILQVLNDEAQIPAADFTEVELIGWLYQFYISDKKDEVFKGFKAKKKARPEDIPAATQIFTPKWIVNYMVENTVGKIYLDFEEDSDLKGQMKYLVENETDGKGALIDDIEQLTLIDPACGSGHILVIGFEWLYKMYREQGYSAKNAIESILKHNLFGLDIDDRAMQLARFAVLLKAAQQLQQVDVSQAIAVMNNPVEVIPHIYAFPEKHAFPSESVAIFTQNQHVAEVYKAFEQLREGKNIGSALKIELSDTAREFLIARYYDWNTKAKQGTLDIEEVGVWQQLKNYVEVALVLSKKYTAVVANPPYMGEDSYNSILKDYLYKYYPNTKYDLSSVFMIVTKNLLNDIGVSALINQSAWLTKYIYKDLRKELVLEKLLNFDTILYLGSGVFPELKGEVVQSVCFTFSNRNLNCFKFFKINSNKIKDKENYYLSNKSKYTLSNISGFEQFEGYQICPWIKQNIIETLVSNPISLFGDAKQGIKTGDNLLFIKNWFEISMELFKLKWFPVNNGGANRKWYGNNFDVLNWYNAGYDIKNFRNEQGKLRSRPQNIQYFFKEGITWSTSSSSQNVVFRFSSNDFVFESSGSKFFCDNNSNLLDILSYFNSKVSRYFIEIFTNGRGVSEGAIKQLPYMPLNGELVRGRSQNSISISKKDWNSRETSWDFEVNPLLARREKGEGEISLKASYEVWKAEVSQVFFQLHANEEELNRIFIDIYSLQEELTPEVALKDITILQDELKADDLDVLETEFREKGTVNLPIQQNIVMQQLLSYLVGTMLGRYRLDQPRLHIAHPNPTEKELASYQVENAALPFQMAIDEDAIIPLMGSACAFPDDAVKRVDELLHRIWGDESHTENLNFLNQALGMPYEKWMCEQFWAYHISGTMYKKKPIYWLFCSNPKSPQKSAFRVLVYMHRMDAYTVQKILRNYLHPHIEYVKAKYQEMHDNEANLNKQELKDLEHLAKQLSELKEYEQVLKDLANQQITFDLDDGVTVNYAKFEGAVAVIK